MKMLTALLMALVLIASSLPTGASAAKKASTTITVTTQKELNAALKSGKYKKIILSTQEKLTVDVKKGEYTNMNLV